MSPLVDLLVKFLIANWGTISSVALTVIVGLIKRWADKNGIKDIVAVEVN